MIPDETTPLEAKLRDRIAREGPIPVAEFMALCLYDRQHGYYSRRAALGAEGDFVTAPEISQMFGELVGLWAAETWRLMGAPDPVLLIEFGPGRGTMMADALRAAKTLPEFRKALRVHLIETSPNMQLRQRQTLSGVRDVMLRWHATLDEAPEGPAIIVANEFFDALPIQQAERRADGWHERAIAINAGGQLALTVMAQPRAELEGSLPASVARAPIGAIFEWREDRYAVEIARRIANGGAALVIDYGHLRSSPGDTFQAVRSHKYASPLALPGLTDLTAHVDFEALGRAATRAGTRIHGPVEQGIFLKRLGIEARAAVLQESADEEGRAQIVAALERLTADGPTAMGTMFKAIGLSAPGMRDLPGFAP